MWVDYLGVGGGGGGGGGAKVCYPPPPSKIIPIPPALFLRLWTMTLRMGSKKAMIKDSYTQITVYDPKTQRERTTHTN